MANSDTGINKVLTDIGRTSFRRDGDLLKTILSDPKQAESNLDIERQLQQQIDGKILSK